MKSKKRTSAFVFKSGVPIPPKVGNTGARSSKFDVLFDTMKVGEMTEMGKSELFGLINLAKKRRTGMEFVSRKTGAKPGMLRVWRIK